MVVIAHSTGFNVTVTSWPELSDGRCGEPIIIGEFESEIASDAFDYMTQARGYFRFAIQAMGAKTIEIEIRLDNRLIELVEITRD